MLEVSYYGSSTTNCFPAFDGNGNVMALVNAADGSTAANYEYGPFGEVIRATGAMARNNPFRFSTKYADDESDLLYYGYRYYKPSTGTWPNRDPLEENGGINIYGFLKNNSINSIDKDGRVALVDDAAVITVLGALALCAAAEAWIQSPAGQQAIHDIDQTASSLADAVKKAIARAMPQCPTCGKKCLPCSPAVGSIAYRVDMPPSPPHNGIPAPHSHKYQMNQSPPIAGCKCFWVEIEKDPIPGILSPVITPASGGGIAP